jgi:hypothetical protein
MYDIIKNRHGYSEVRTAKKDSKGFREFMQVYYIRAWPETQGEETGWKKKSNIK